MYESNISKYLTTVVVILALCLHWVAATCAHIVTSCSLALPQWLLLTLAKEDEETKKYRYDSKCLYTVNSFSFSYNYCSEFLQSKDTKSINCLYMVFLKIWSSYNL